MRVERLFALLVLVRRLDGNSHRLGDNLDADLETRSLGRRRRSRWSRLGRPGPSNRRSGRDGGCANGRLLLGFALGGDRCRDWRRLLVLDGLALVFGRRRRRVDAGRLALLGQRLVAPPLLLGLLLLLLWHACPLSRLIIRLAERAVRLGDDAFLRGGRDRRQCRLSRWSRRGHSSLQRLAHRRWTEDRLVHVRQVVVVVFLVVLDGREVREGLGQVRIGRVGRQLDGEGRARREKHVVRGEGGEGRGGRQIGDRRLDCDGTRKVRVRRG